VKVPIFPLNTVLFPGGPLPLRIFESRYIDMISERMKAEAPFGVVLIRDGQEAGPSSTFETGTLARITDWYQGSDGLLGVTAIGEQRFRLLASERQPDGLNVGEIELLPDEPAIELPAQYQFLTEILGAVMDDLGKLYEPLERDMQNATWLGYRFMEVLPIDLEQKQESLESNDTLARLEIVSSLIQAARSGV
jgi:Lon protease-like protein